MVPRGRKRKQMPQSMAVLREPEHALSKQTQMVPLYYDADTS